MNLEVNHTMETLRSISAGLAFAAWVCAMTAVNDAARGAFDGSSAAMVVCACFMGGFAAAVLCYTKGGE